MQRGNKELTILKTFVYMLGIVMMVGVLSIAYLIYKRNLSDVYEGSAQDELAQTEQACGGQLPLEINAAGSVEHVYFHNNYMIVVTKYDEIKQQIFVLDYCQGEIVRSIIVDTLSKGQADVLKHSDLNKYTG
jgi:hypothetical protein